MSKLTSPIFGFYCRHLNIDSMCYHKFSTLDQAKTFLDIIIQNQPYTEGEFRIYPSQPNPEPMITTATGITIRGPGLLAALEHALRTPHTFSNNDRAMFEAFAQGRRSSPTLTLDEPEQVIAKLPKTKAPPVPKTPKTPKAPKPSTSGLISAGDIASAMGLDAKQVRDALRKSGTPKPDHGWAFTQAEAPIIAKTIAANLKAGTPFTPYSN